MERWVGRGGWSLESAGVRAINLAGISELMNVIKIQPPTRWVPSAGRSVYGRGGGGWNRSGRYRQGREDVGGRGADRGHHRSLGNGEEERKEKRNPEKRL